MSHRCTLNNFVKCLDGRDRPTVSECDDFIRRKYECPPPVLDPEPDRDSGRASNKNAKDDDFEDPIRSGPTLRKPSRGDEDRGESGDDEKIGKYRDRGKDRESYPKKKKRPPPPSDSIEVDQKTKTTSDSTR